MKLTPEFLVSFESTIKGLVTGNWQRVMASGLMWDRVMKKRPGEGKQEYLTWLLETAKLYPEGAGGNKRFDDMVATSFSIEHDDFGAGLRLTKNEIEDNQLRDNPTMGALDYASKWARDMGANFAYFPQQQLFDLIAAGTTALCYDGQPFFSAVHPLNPNGGGGTYSNIVTAVPINAAAVGTEIDAFILAQKNFAKALAAVSSQKFLNGIPRYLRPTVLLVPTALEYRARQMVQATIAAQTTNVLATQGIEVIADANLDGEPDVYYLGVEDLLSDELGAFVYSEREPFQVKTYGPMTEAALARMKVFEWDADGRNAAFYGHPYLFYRCEPT